MVAQLESWQYPIDVVGLTNFYTGPSAHTWERFLKGFRSLWHEHVMVIQKGDDLQIALRSLPGILPNFLQAIWSFFVLKPLIRKRYKVCIFGSPNNALLAIVLKKLGFIETLIYDDWDFFPADATTVKGHLDKLAMQWKEKLCIRYADFVISVSHFLSELRKKQGAKKVLVITNGVDYPRFQESQNKRPHPPTLFYMGHLYSPWGVDLPILALPAIRAKIPDVRYVVVGEGPECEALKALAYEKMNLQDCVSFLGGQDSHKMPFYLAEADIGVLTCRPDPFRKYASPLKAFEYMAAGLPVVGTRVSEIVKVIEASHAGIIIDSSPGAFAEAVIGLFTDLEKYKWYSANAIRCGMGYDWVQVFAPLHNLLNNLLAEPRPAICGEMNP
jgi:glycosyltransferase involved in cell wall biosynthesis